MTAVLAIIAALCLATLLQPTAAIAGAFCMFGLEQWAQAISPFFVMGGNRALINYCIGIIVLLGLAKKIIGGQPILRGYPAVGLLVVMLFSYALVSTLWAPNPARSLSAFLAQAPYIVTITFLCPLLCSSTADFERMLVATFLLGTVLVSLLMFTVEWDGRSVALPSEYVSFTGNALATGSLGGTIAIIAAFSSWPKFRSLDILKWIVVILGLLLAVRSGSRGQTFGVIMVILVCWPIAHRLDGFKAFAGLGSVTLVIVAALFWGLDAYWADSGSARWTEEGLEESGDGRLGRSHQVLDAWSKTVTAMLFGLGNSASGEIIGTYSHIIPVDILTEEGILGFLIYVGIILSCLRTGLSSFSLVRHHWRQRMQLAALCALCLYYFLLSLKQGNLLSSPFLFMSAIFLGQHRKFLAQHNWRVQASERDRSIISTT
ncbi:MAG: O-antigen ligase family protein, partial [Gammaproteobacteria bacterium]